MAGGHATSHCALLTDTTEKPTFIIHTSCLVFLASSRLSFFQRPLRTMNKSSGPEAEASELRQRRTEATSATNKNQVDPVEGLVPRNATENRRTNSPSKTYGRTPDGTGERMMKHEDEREACFGLDKCKLD